MRLSAVNFEKISRILWAAVLLTLPVTSFRYFPGLGETTFVRPLSFYPLALLLPIVLVQLLRRQIPSPFPGSLVLLGFFALAVIATTAFGGLYAPLDLRGQTYWGRALRAWATLIIGVSFFMAAVWMNRDRDDLMFTLKWLLAGLVLDVAWSGLQAVTFYTPLLKKEVVTHWQRAFSMRELVRTNRISGLAYEPAWLAGQIGTLYLPWLFAAVMTSTRLTRFKWLEPLLLGLSGLLLLLTFSRGGLLAVAVSVGLTSVLVGGRAFRRARDWMLAPARGRGNLAKRVQAWGGRIGVVFFILVILAGAVLFLSQKEIFQNFLDFSKADSVQDYFVDNFAGARLAYLVGAMGAYETAPWTGVGLGASGFYLYDHLPDWALTTLPEIARLLNLENRIYPNPKNMYVRLLAETGLLGLAFFLAFQASLLADALGFLRDKFGPARFAAIAGLCAWIAVLVYNLTQDSFATPNLWITAGILAGLTRVESEGSTIPEQSG